MLRQQLLLHIIVFIQSFTVVILSTVDVGEVTGSRTGVKAIGTNTDAQSAIPQSVKEAVTTAYDDKAAECDSKRTDTSA